MKSGHEFSAKRIADFLSERLEGHKMPKIIRDVNNLPKTPVNQKINRKELLNYE
jgi:acyl-coenzyme A synthetase/AMP-(fatty) acid ligase